MALIWADPFDQYGTATGANSFMSNAGYNSVNITAWQPGRTGARSIQLNNNTAIQRPLASPSSTLIQGVAFNAQSIPFVSINLPGIGFYSAGPTMECRVVTQPDLSIGVYDRTGTLKGSTPPNQFVTNSWYYLEVKAEGNVGGVVNTGKVTVRINGITQLTINGINFPNVFAYHLLGGFQTGGLQNSTHYFDDYVVCDNSGAFNNDFIGDRRLFLSYPNANGPSQDWTPTTAPAWDLLNNSPPNDAAYIEAAAAGNISSFAKDAIGINSNDIAAMVVMGRLFKSDAGAATGRIGIDSNGVTVNSPELAPGLTGVNYALVVERDPNGNIAWTRAAADAAELVVTRAS